MIDKIIKEIASYDKVLILGFGREGKSTYNLIRKYLKDKFLYIADLNTKLLDNNSYLCDDKNLKVILGENYLDNLGEYDLIIKAPGVNFKNVEYESFQDKITYQSDLFLKYADCMTIGVTGTKGKSTTSSLINYILSNTMDNVIFVGNIGIPIFDKIEEMNSKSIVVIELGVHQLQFIKSSPKISILLNLYEEHLDLYKSYDVYKNSKLNIFKYQKDGDYKIWGLDSVDSYNSFVDGPNTYTFSTDLDKVKNGVFIDSNGLYLVKGNNKELIYSKSRTRKLLGDHNLYNIAASLCVCDILGVPCDRVLDLIDEFNPLEHRMEYVGKYKEIDFYNDSIATIPEAAINCLKSISNAETFIVGGMDRGVDLSTLINYLKTSNIKTCICLKDTGYMIADELNKLNSNIKTIKVNDMEEAVREAYLNTTSGMACVLSPAAASYNVYKNFEERGKDYKNWIEKLSE